MSSNLSASMTASRRFAVPFPARIFTASACVFCFAIILSSLLIEYRFVHEFFGGVRYLLYIDRVLQAARLSRDRDKIKITIGAGLSA